MKTTTMNIKIYQFIELDNEAKDFAINEHAQFLIEFSETEEESNNIDREYTIDNILSNEYYFYQSGKLAHTVKYVGKHKKAGEEYYIKNGIEYRI